MKSESVAYLCSTLCNPMNLPCSLPGSFVHGILQARILEWVAIPFSRDLPNPGMEPRSPVLQANSLPSEAPGKLGRGKGRCKTSGGSLQGVLLVNVHSSA